MRSKLKVPSLFHFESSSNYKKLSSKPKCSAKSNNFMILTLLSILSTLTLVESTLLTVISVIENETVFTAHCKWNPEIIRKSPEGIDVLGLLIKADPPDACTSLHPPPDNNGTYLANWFLLSSWGPDERCHLLTKFQLADEAGYAAIIIQCSKEYESFSIPVDDWEYGLGIFPCLVDFNEGEMLRANYSSEDYILKFEDEPIDTWIRFFLTSFLALLAILLAIGLSYCVVQMFILLVIWLRDSVIQAIAQRRINRRRRLPSSQLKKIPIQQWTTDSPQDMCTICLEHFLENDRVRILPCSHVFHMACIDPWLLNQRRKCPNCKRKIIFPDEPYDSDSSTEDERTPLIRREGSSDQSPSMTFTFTESDFANHPQPIYQAIQRMMAEAASSSNSNINTTDNDLERPESSTASTSQSRPRIQKGPPITDATIRSHMRRLRLNRFSPRVNLSRHPNLFNPPLVEDYVEDTTTVHQSVRPRSEELERQTSENNANADLNGIGSDDGDGDGAEGNSSRLNVFLKALLEQNPGRSLSLSCEVLLQDDEKDGDGSSENNFRLQPETFQTRRRED